MSLLSPTAGLGLPCNRPQREVAWIEIQGQFRPVCEGVKIETPFVTGSAYKNIYFIFLEQ